MGRKRRRKVEHTLRTRPHFIYIVPGHFLIRFIAQEYFRNMPWLLKESQESNFLSVPADLGSMRKQGIVHGLFSKSNDNGSNGRGGQCKSRVGFT